jgi:hypothetical protein
MLEVIGGGKSWDMKFHEAKALTASSVHSTSPLTTSMNEMLTNSLIVSYLRFMFVVISCIMFFNNIIINFIFIAHLILN